MRCSASAVKKDDDKCLNIPPSRYSSPRMDDISRKQAIGHSLITAISTACSQHFCRSAAVDGVDIVDGGCLNFALLALLPQRG